MDKARLILYYLCRGGLEEPSALYGVRWEEQQTEELITFVRRASEELKRREGLASALPQTPVRITRTLRIYVGGEELAIRPMAKSILLLFLSHPEGIPLKRIADHRQELVRLYRRVSRSGDPGTIEARVNRILDLFNNELNVNIARVNRALATLRDRHPRYRIEGAAGAPKRIDLGETPVIWE